MDTQGIAQSQPLRLVRLLGLGLAGLYVSTYFLLSVCGQYQPVGVGCLHEWHESALWMPACFPSMKSGPSSPTPLRLGIMKIFYPLWLADAQWLHSHKDIYWRGYLDDDGKWVYETNSWARNAKGDWIFTNFKPAAVSRK